MGNGTNIGRVRGLGSAREGAKEWFHHKVSAGSNLVLMLWFVLSIARLPAYDYATVQLWLSSAWAAVPMILLILSVFYHFRHGLRTVIEDYQHDETHVVLTVLLDYFVIGTATLAIFSILRIAFTATTGAPA
jgi:succinate dehydrogenase / fumarate reductase, membrane anchor subunit